MCGHNIARSGKKNKEETGFRGGEDPSLKRVGLEHRIPKFQSLMNHEAYWIALKRDLTCSFQLK